MLERYDLKEFIKQFFKFGLVGILNTLITLAVIFLLMHFSPASYVIANAAGYILGFINSFILNKTWTFKSKGPVGKESIGFIIVFAVTYGIQLGVLVYLKENLKVDAHWAQVIAMVFYTGINFLGNKLFTFRK